MIQAIGDVARPALSLAFVAFCVFALDRFITWNSRRLNAHQTRRLFTGNRDARRDPVDPFAELISESFRRKATEPEGRASRAVPVLRENARSHRSA